MPYFYHALLIIRETMQFRPGHPDPVYKSSDGMQGIWMQAGHPDPLYKSSDGIQGIWMQALKYSS